MFITKKHIPRRAVLKGAGVALGLPFLEAMVPAATALAQTTAVPKLRTGFFYIPHGAIMGNTSHGPTLDKWTPSGSGADFKLSPILASFFLWNIGPDEELLTLASANGLTRPGVMEKQVRRMLADPRASSLVSSFAMKWLDLTTLDQVVPDPTLFPEFAEPRRAEQLRRDFSTE